MAPTSDLVKREMQAEFHGGATNPQLGAPKSPAAKHIELARALQRLQMQVQNLHNFIAGLHGEVASPPPPEQLPENIPFTKVYESAPIMIHEQIDLIGKGIDELKRCIYIP